MATKRNSKIVLFLLVALVTIAFFPIETAAWHDPPGIRANSGSVSTGAFSAFIESWSAVFQVHTAYDYSGDLYVKGHSVASSGSIVYYCLIKISPEDSYHKHLQIKVDCDFKYGISAGWFSSASWELWYGTFNLEGYPIHQNGFPAVVYGDYAGGIFGGAKEGQHWNDPNAYLKIYDRIIFDPPVYNPREYLVEFSHTKWYYVGLKLWISLYGYADIYEAYGAVGNAHFNPVTIYWNFFA